MSAAHDNLGIIAVVEELKKQGWQFEGRLGRGGFGEVYRARVENIPRAVRISLDPIEQKSAEREKQIIEDLAQLQLITHPRLVSLVSYRIVLGHLVTVWELADEPIRDLARLLETYRKQGQPGIPRDRLIRYIWHLAEAIDFLNGRGLYHRDIKPGNCLLFQGEVKLADFGLTRFASVSQTRLSTAGAGTLGYAPPEVWENQHHSSGDLYALAVMYAHLATGHHPFAAEQGNPIQVIERQRRGEWDLRGLSQTDQTWVATVLEPDPEKRFAGGARAWVKSLHQARLPQDRPVAAPTRSNSTRANGPVINVRPRDSLAAVVGKAAEGSHLVLQPGTYRLQQPLRIDKSLTIEGTDRDTTIITCDQEGVVLEYNGGELFGLKKVSVIHLGGQPANVVAISSGIVQIEDCVFRGGVWDKQRQFGGVGLWLHGVARGTVRNCLCTANALHGIEISEHAQPVVEGNTCEQNAQFGIAYSGSAGGTARNNVSRSNGYHGIGLHEQARPVVEGNTCEKNTQCGIAYFDSAGGAARNNVCRANGYHGIAVSEQAQPMLEGNTCEKNTYNGIAYFGSAGGTARNNVCRSNGYHGVGVHEQAQPMLEGNTCEKNTQCGIAYFGSAGGTARNNVCRANGRWGIYAQDQAQPMLEGNTCEKNTLCGIAYLGSAGGTARNNVCRSNGYHGIQVNAYKGDPATEHAQPVLEGNTCEQNAQSGIAYFGSAGGAARNNVCRANGYHGIAVSEQAQPMLEGNTCEGNTCNGIGYFGSAGGTARNNTCRDNAFDGILVWEKAHPELDGNQCHGNRYGICVSRTAQPKLGLNKLFGNRSGDLGRE